IRIGKNLNPEFLEPPFSLSDRSDNSFTAVFGAADRSDGSFTAVFGSTHRFCEPLPKTFSAVA
ncbi:MAG: hypothetical protein IKZ17_02110, partial [Bacteroidaceae bacterium]|nr:hypothetical protein [Bacteroidaceae bacterium]